MQQWEHTWVNVSYQGGISRVDGQQINVERKLNELGAAGWELVAIVPLATDLNTFVEKMYFKRPKPAEA